MRLGDKARAGSMKGSLCHTPHCTTPTRITRDFLTCTLQLGTTRLLVHDFAYVGWVLNAGALMLGPLVELEL